VQAIPSSHFSPIYYASYIYTMNPRVLAKRKSEADINAEVVQPQNKRLLTERIAAGMGVLSLNNSPDAQGNSRPPFIRTNSTPSSFYHAQTFMPARPDLVSSFELQRPYQPQPMDEDLEMSCEPSPQQQCTTAHNTPNAPTIYSQTKTRHLLNNAPKPGNTQNPQLGLYPIIDDDEPEDTPKFKMLIPIPNSPSIDIPLIYHIANPDSRALILYTSPKEVIEESLQRDKEKNTPHKDTETMADTSPIMLQEITTTATDTQDVIDGMMLD